MKKKKKVLLTGGSGLLALNWGLHLKDLYEVVLGLHQKIIDVPGIACVPVQIETKNGFLADLTKIQPDVVIHCAGLANVEASESNPFLAHHINVELSANVAMACREMNVVMVYISTDHLFDGSRALVSEEDTPSPLNEYGRTKLGGENAVLEISSGNLAIRTNFYGWGTSYRHSFSDMIISNIRAGRQVSLFDDFYYTPILIEELANTVMALYTKQAGGVFNVVGNERVSKYEFGMRTGEKFKLDISLIKAVKFAEMKGLVQRPLDISLSNKKTMAFLNTDFGNINANLETLYQQEQDGFSNLVKKI